MAVVAFAKREFQLLLRVLKVPHDLFRRIQQRGRKVHFNGGIGPQKMQQLSEAKSGQFRVLGFAGNTAPDHIDHLHALAELVKGMK